MNFRDITSKIYKDPVLLAKILNKKRTLKNQVILTNGCFDLIHRGHLEYLIQASSLGKIFVIILNSDASIKKLKGHYRPIQSEDDRSFLLSCFKFVDYVLISGPDERLNRELELLPIDIYVKGGDYCLDDLDPGERQILQKKGCKFHFIKFILGHSTTELIHKILLADD